MKGIDVMKTYLVDFENVKSKGLTGIDSLDETDSVIIFYSENSDTISFEMHQKVLCSKADIEYFKVNVGGKNALDFQLSTLLGYLVGKGVYSHIFVISNDKGFDFLHDFWHGKYISSPNCVVYRTRTISAAINYSGDKKKIQADTENQTQIEISEENTESVLSVESNDTANSEPVEVEPIKTEVVLSTEENNDTAVLDGTENDSIMINAAEDDNVSAEEVVLTEPTEKPDTADKAENSEITLTDENVTAAETTGYRSKLDEILSKTDCSKEDIDTISQLLPASSTKEEFHNLLAKSFKQQATDLYKILRPMYLKLKDLYNTENPNTDIIESNDNELLAKSSEEIKSIDKDEKLPAKKKNRSKAAKREKNAAAKDEEKIFSGEISPRLAELLAGQCSDDELKTISELFESAATRQQLYIRMIKAFKKDKGCQFYNAVRAEYAAQHK